MGVGGCGWVWVGGCGWMGVGGWVGVGGVGGWVGGGNPCSEGLFHHMSNFQFQFPLYKQGHTASLTHRVQRSYGLGWDIRADHPDVPAVCHDVLSLSKLFDDFQGIVLSYA